MKILAIIVQPYTKTLRSEGQPFVMSQRVLIPLAGQWQHPQPEILRSFSTGVCDLMKSVTFSELHRSHRSQLSHLKTQGFFVLFFLTWFLQCFVVFANWFEFWFAFIFVSTPACPELPKQTDVLPTDTGYTGRIVQRWLVAPQAWWISQRDYNLISDVKVTVTKERHTHSHTHT